MFMSEFVAMEHSPEALKSISPKHWVDPSSPGGQMVLNGVRTSQSLHPGVHRKPNCSYNCLIGMALKSSKRKCLPVNEIYAFCLNKFPYFRNSAPEGWKNSIRHSLSLGPYFRKTQVAGFQGKKGFQWEAIPDKVLTLNQEISKFLAEEGKTPQQFGIESLYGTDFFLYEALSSSREQWPINPSKPQNEVTNSKVSASLQPTSIPSDSANFTLSVSSPGPQCPLVITDRQKLPGINKPTETLLTSGKNSEHSIPSNEEIGGILAYLKDGAPLDSIDLQSTTSGAKNSSKACKENVSIKAIKDTMRDSTLLVNLDIQNHDSLAEEVKKFVITCECPTFQHEMNPFQDDVDDWLCLELVDDDNTDGNDTVAELSSVLMSDVNQSLNEVNSTSVFDHVLKHVDFTYTGGQTSVRCRKSCSDDKFLDPVDDWNQWNEPTYVERMISLCNYLNCNKNTDVMEYTASCSSAKQAKSIQVKSIDITSKPKKTDNNYCVKIKKSVSMVGDHRRAYAYKLASVKQSCINNEHPSRTQNKKAVTPQRCPKKCCKCLRSSETMKLVVSISFDRLVTARQFKKYHFKVTHTSI